MKIPFLFVLFFCIMSSLYAESESYVQNEVNDSLQSKTLDELTFLFWRGKDIDSVTKISLRDAYMAKAKEKGDPIKIADGYQMFMSKYNGNYDVLLKYSDSIINITKDLKNHHYPGTGYIFKGGILRNMERYNEALESLLKAKAIAEFNKYEIQVIDAEDIIAELKTILGKNEEALEIYKKHFSVLSKKDNINKNEQNYISTVYLLANSYNKIHEYDSAHYYINIGIKHSLANYYNLFYPELVFTSGVNNFYRNEYGSAIDSLQKTLSLLKYNVDDIKVRMAYFT